MMKKTVCFFLFLALLLALVGCGSTSGSVESKITAIGNVTEASGEAISQAREAYSELSEQAKETVSNYDLLVKAEEQYDDIWAKKVDSLITQLDIPQSGIPDEGAKQRIREAREAYDALTETQQKKVEGIKDLQNAEAIVNSPYGIPLYETAEDVDLSVILSRHNINRLVDLFDGFNVSVEDKYIKNGNFITTFEIDRYFFKDDNNGKWENPEYVMYYVSNPTIHASSGRGGFGSVDLLLYNPSLYDGEPCTICISEQNDIKKFPHTAEELEEALHGHFLPFKGDFVVTKAELSDGKYRIYFDMTEEPVEYTNCCVIIDPETSLICGYECIRLTNSAVQQDDTAQVNYGLDAIPDYSSALSGHYPK